MSVTHANKTESAQEQQGVKSVGETAPQFADNRASTTAQLAMQQRMHNSPRSTAQRATANAMNASPVQQQKTIQRAEAEEELQLQAIPQTAQLAGMDEEEPLQGKFETAQRAEDEELLQGKFETVQRAEDEELLQGKFETAQRAEDEELLQGKFEPAQRAEKPNNTGLPDNLKSGIENLSGMSMDHVKVHYNSDKPAQLQAHAYAQGSEIHVAPGQEQHLPHDAWHVVQQAQGRVRPTVQMKGDVPVNTDVGLESEADVMGGKALSLSDEQPAQLQSIQLSAAQASIVSVSNPVAQLQIGHLGQSGDKVFHTEFYLGEITEKKDNNYTVKWYSDSPPSIIRADDPKCEIFEKKPIPKGASKPKKNNNKKQHDKEMQKKAGEKQQREAAETEKMKQKRQLGKKIWKKEENRLLNLLAQNVRGVEDSQWRKRIAEKFSGLKSELEDGDFSDSANEPYVLEGSNDRDNEWIAEVWKIVANKNPRGELPARRDLWEFLVEKKMSNNDVYYDPNGGANLHLTVSGNSIDEIDTFDAEIFDQSPDSIYDHLFLKSGIGMRVHVTWQGEYPVKHLYVGGVNGDGHDFYNTVWAQTEENASTVRDMRKMLDEFRKRMIGKFIQLKLCGWKLE